MRSGMARSARAPSNDEEAVDKLPQQEPGLSARILGLLSAVKLEERRKARGGKHSGPAGERRRRTDQSEPTNGGSS